MALPPENTVGAKSGRNQPAQELSLQEGCRTYLSENGQTFHDTNQRSSLQNISGIGKKLKRDFFPVRLIKKASKAVFPCTVETFPLLFLLRKTGLYTISAYRPVF